MQVELDGKLRHELATHCGSSILVAYRLPSLTLDQAEATANILRL